MRRVVSLGVSASQHEVTGAFGQNFIFLFNSFFGVGFAKLVDAFDEFNNILFVDILIGQEIILCKAKVLAELIIPLGVVTIDVIE